ncbi:serine/threonine-protein kinase [Streptomyces sp. NPDC004579]|uniref:serine/threonine-protein kinase n=1 Tax=Streptomyces sp. NPDC004579 TaxID=3154667 RepID=UPI0033A4494B
MSEAERAGASRQDKSERLLAGRYRLGDVLGRGGMGTVWRAEDETLGRTVAVKELRFPSAIDEDEKRRLITRTLREAKAIARIRNNGAVTVFDVVDEDNRPWIVMELIEGKSLAEAIREDGLLTPRRAAEVGLAILDVLQAAHREGILHRDVKPSNVLISGDDGRVVLTDFGIAQVEGDPSITSTGMLVGAPSYISPERARGHKPGPAADLWSLGGLLYAAVEGVPPYDKGSAIATLTAVMTEPVEQPKNAGPLEKVIYGLLAKDPEQRLDDAGARSMLNEVLRTPEPERNVPEPPDATKVVAMPPLPEEPARRGGSSGGKKGEEPAERLRGALRSVRKAATAAGAATAAATSAATARAKAAGSPDSAQTAGAAKTASPQAGSASGADAGQAGGVSVAATAVNASVPGQPGGSDGKAGNSATGAGAGAGGRRGGSGSGWPVAPERPARPAPKASLTDVVPLRTLVILAVVVALVVVGTVLAITLGGGDDDGAKGGGGGTRATASAGASGGSGKSGDDSKSDDTGKSGDKGKSDAAHTDSDDKSGSGSDDGAGASSDPSTGDSDGSGGDGKESGSGSTAVKTYTSGQGFSIGLPKGWKYASQDAAGARFTGPDGQKLLVGWTSTPKDDPVADWENQERYMVRSQYKKIRIESVSYRGWNTADWEFTYVDGGTKFHSIDRGFVVNAHQGYALMYTAKDAAWGSALRKSTWATLAGTFQPKS